MRALMVSALLNVVLSLLLVTRAGLFGVLIATTCSTIVGYGLFMGSLHRYLKLPLAVFARKVYALPAAGAAAAVVALLALGHPIALLEGGAQLESVRLAALVDLAVTGALFFAVYGAIIFKSRYIALGDLGLVRKALASWS
jgi:O-antigen/teichoic acid export membrane protein